MSDNWLILVPDNPRFQPATNAAKIARDVLAKFIPNADSVTADFTDEIQFVDSGGNWEGVGCPSCGADAEPWWPDAMGDAAASDFEGLDVTTPCCGATVSLNDLEYKPPVGFARFILSAMNPNVRDLTGQQVEQLAAVLGTTLRRIWRHI